MENCLGWYKERNDKMEKPFTIKVQETEQEIIKVINNSNLPAYVLKTIFQNLYNQLEEIDNKEMQKYAESLKNKETESEKESDN